MVLLHNLLLRKCAPDQMSWSAADRAILCTTKKFVKSVSTWITSQPIIINGNLQHTSYRFSFVDVTLQVDALFEVVHSAKNWRSRRCTSHAWHSALIVQRTETVLYHTLPGNFGVRFLGEIHHPGAHFQLLASAWRFEMIENRCRLARKWCIRAGIEPNAMIGQLVKTQTPTGCGATNISDTKRHTHDRLLANLMPTRMHGENKLFFWGRA